MAIAWTIAWMMVPEGALFVLLLSSRITFLQFSFPVSLQQLSCPRLEWQVELLLVLVQLQVYQGC